MLGDLGRIRPAATAKGGFSILVSNILVSNIVEPFLSSLPLSAPSKKDLLWFRRFVPVSEVAIWLFRRFRSVMLATWIAVQVYSTIRLYACTVLLVLKNETLIRHGNHYWTRLVHGARQNRFS